MPRVGGEQNTCWRSPSKFWLVFKSNWGKEGQSLLDPGVMDSLRDGATRAMRYSTAMGEQLWRLIDGWKHHSGGREVISWCWETADISFLGTEQWEWSGCLEERGHWSQGNDSQPKDRNRGWVSIWRQDGLPQGRYWLEPRGVCFVEGGSSRARGH